MDAFEKWWHGPQPILGDGKFHDGKEVAQEAFIAGKAEGIKEGLRRAAAMAGTMAERPFDSEPEFSAVLAVEAAILKEAGK